MRTTHLASEPSSTDGRTPGAPELASALDESRFEVVYHQTARPLWAYLRRVLGSSVDADDVLQETYCRFLTASPQEMDAAETRAYLFTIASRLVVDHWRRGQRRPRTVDADLSRVEAASRDVASDLDVARALDSLKPQERALVWLAYVEGSSHRLIADAVGVKEKSVKVLLFRARRKLAQLLGR